MHLGGNHKISLITSQLVDLLQDGNSVLCGYEFKLAYTDTNDTAALDSLLVSISPAVKQLAEIRSLVAGSYHVRHDEDKAKKIDNDLVASFDNLTSIAMFDTAFWRVVWAR